MKDEILYRRYLDGDESGLKELIGQYGDSLTLYINGYVHDVHEAEELMIEVFAYLYKSARNMALRHKSRKHPCFSFEDMDKEPESETLIEEVIKTKERNRLLHLCMEQLNDEYREALYLVYFEEMSYSQAGQIMGKSIKQITNMVYRGKQSLRGLLEREGITNAE